MNFIKRAFKALKALKAGINQTDSDGLAATCVAIVVVLGIGGIIGLGALIAYAWLFHWAVGLVVSVMALWLPLRIVIELVESGDYV